MLLDYVDDIRCLIAYQWERYLHKDRNEAVSMLQAALLGQTYGMLSGNSDDLSMTASFHGTIISWARQKGLFQVKNAFPFQASLGEANPETAWREWAKNEEAYRIVLGLRIHDAEFATMFHHEPFLRHNAGDVLAPCSDYLFEASSANEWIAVGTSSDPSISSGDITLSLKTRSGIHDYVLLGGIMASIAEADCAGTREKDMGIYRQRLMSWYVDRALVPGDKSYDVLCMTILWHEAFMALYVSFDLLDRIAGRDGVFVQETAVPIICGWVKEPRGKRSLVHALLLLKNAQSLPVSAEPAIHVPKALFYAGIIVFCHVRFCSSDVSFSNVDIPELQCMAGTSITSASLSHIHTTDWVVLHEIFSLLQRYGHWELSRRFASILEVLIDSITDSGAFQLQ